MTQTHFDQVCIELRIKAINNFTVENNDKKTILKPEQFQNRFLHENICI